jgi:polar amino acid transport system substrate-binding protein
LIKIGLLICLLSTYLSLSAYAEDIVALESSEWRPYVYLEDNKPKGLVYEIAKDIFDRAEVNYAFSIKPWARVYMSALNRKNYVITGIGRTTEREKLFQWIAPLTKEFDIYFYKLRTNPIQINNIEEAKRHLTGVERSSYYQNFIDTHFTSNKRVLAVTSDQLLKMLMLKRVDFILLEEKRVLEISEKLSIDPNLFEKTFFAFSVQNYLAASLNTDTALIVKLRKAYTELKQENLINLPK